MEEFDIVNEDDEIIGKTTRLEAHTLGHIHRSTVFFILDKQNRIFVNQRSVSKEFYPEYWSIAMGGHVGTGENYENTVIREVKEEAGINEKPIFLTSFKKRFDDNDKENIRVYAFVTKQQIILHSGEFKKGQFMTVEELKEKLKNENFLPETPTLFRILKDYFSKDV